MIADFYRTVLSHEYDTHGCLVMVELHSLQAGLLNQ